MSNKETNNWSDIWIKPSLDLTPNQSKQKVKQKSRKREITEEIDDKSNDNKFRSDSICLLDSMVTEDTNQLAFSRYKCNELNDWFRRQFKDKTFESKYLLMNGPTGAGKTTSLRVMAKEFAVEVIEYNTYSQYFETTFDDNLNEKRENSLICLNQIQNFHKFIGDCVRYKTRLDLGSKDGVIDSTQTQTTDRLVLIEEFPNVFYSKPEALHKELRSLDKRFGNRLIPIVFIISETTNGHSEEYKLLPKSLQLELNIKTITFHSITNTSMNKILQRLSDNQLSKIEIQNLIDSSSGDVRSAINNLQLLYMHSIDTNSDKSGKRLRKTKPKIESNCDYLLRDPSLTITHAIGKVLYAKRNDPDIHLSDSIEHELEVCYELPDHLSAYERNPLTDCPESIAEKIVVSSDVFNGWLHENYIEFCDNLESAQNCMDWLCETDVLFSGLHLSDTKHVFESYQSSLAMRGLMFNISTANRRSIDSESDPKPKPIRKFKSFKRPQVFVANRSVDSLKRQINHTLSQNILFSNTSSLVIDFMPFISQMPNHLRSFDSNLKYILDKVVTYDHNSDQINEHDLCYTLSHTSVDIFEETTNESIFQTNNNQKTVKEKVIQIDNNLDKEEDYIVEDIDSD